MVNAPNFVKPDADTKEEDSNWGVFTDSDEGGILRELFIHHSNREEQERLEEMFRNQGPSIRMKINTEKLKE